MFRKFSFYAVGQVMVFCSTSNIFHIDRYEVTQESITDILVMLKDEFEADCI